MRIFNLYQNNNYTGEGLGVFERLLDLNNKITTRIKILTAIKAREANKSIWTSNF